MKQRFRREPNIVFLYIYLYMKKKEIAIEIQNIFDNNELEDLKRFMTKRQWLNCCNMYMIYIFHTIQSAGILVTTIAAGYDNKNLIWFGVGLNVIASLITIFEKTNDSISKKLLKNMEDIKKGVYIDEGMVIDIEKETNPENSKSYQQTTTNPVNENTNK